MHDFDFQPRTRIVYGAGKLDELGALAAEIGGSRALVVSDGGIVAAGHTGRGLRSLQAAGVETQLFDAVHENPTTVDVDAAVAVARDYKPDLLVGLGGGSSMDCAKGTNFLYTNGGRMQDYWGVGKATRPMLPMIAVPTTAGTGSEAQSFALISDAETHAKMACGDKKAACRLAILDPSLTLTQPARITAVTGIDAIAHAVETFVTKVRNPMSMAFSREAWRLLASSFGRVIDDPQDLAARGSMQLGACFAGMAIENSMLGAAHALANPLTAHYGVIHGEAVALMLPHVVRYNGHELAEDYRSLMRLSFTSAEAPHPAEGPDGLSDFLSTLARRAHLPQRLSERGVEPGALPQLAHNAAKQWTGTFNPRPVGEEECLAIYERAM
jgi:alcohol dehydrogenase